MEPEIPADVAEVTPAVTLPETDFIVPGELSGVIPDETDEGYVGNA